MASILLGLTIAAPSFAQDKPTDPPASGPIRYCYYAGLKYSTWAALPNGQICQLDGTWTYPQVAGTETSSSQPPPAP